ncbi:Protein FLX-like 2 [Hirschfeldia incana]|nr:Protein FLX-like 2 [Hirschfeldia incana]
MGSSNGRVPPPHHTRHALPPHPEAFPSFNTLPPPQLMEQKLASQHGEMQRLAIENQRLAATHGNLRQELASSQHELQMLHSQIGSMKSEGEQRMSGLADRVAKMEAELRKSEALKVELQEARGEARGLVVAREELMSKVHHLTQEIQRSRADVQQVPALMSELDGLRQEYQQCRATYDYEKKYYNDHIESLQVMEKNYMSMAMEVQKLQAQLMMNSANSDRGAGVPYNTAEHDASQSGVGYYGDAYQGYIPPPPAGNATAPNPVVGTAQYPYQGVTQQGGYFPSGPGYYFPRGPPPPPGSYNPPPGSSNNTPYGSAATTGPR